MFKKIRIIYLGESNPLNIDLSQIEEKIINFAKLEDYSGRDQENNTHRILRRDTLIIGGVEQNTSDIEGSGVSPEEEKPGGHFPRTVILTAAAFVHRVDGVILEGVG